MKSIQVDGDVYAYFESHGMSAGHSASDVLRQALFHEIDLDDDVFANLMSLASGPDDTINAILRRALGIQASPSNPPPVTSPARIDFHIPAGTGARPWNTRDTAVKGIVGQTLRIYNDDSVAHEPHTNGQPFPHPASAIAPGVFADFVLSSPYDLDTPAPGIYDHAQGAAARFWISVIAA
jgi:negative regulator of replication initiation